MVVMMSPTLMPALSAGTAGGDALHEYPVLEAVDAIDRAGEPFAELDADGAARYFVAGADKVVVDGHNGVRRHGEADALVAVRLV
jgi:hypothetical protein